MYTRLFLGKLFKGDYKIIKVTMATVQLPEKSPQNRGFANHLQHYCDILFFLSFWKAVILFVDDMTKIYHYCGNRVIFKNAAFR